MIPKDQGGGGRGYVKMKTRISEFNYPPTIQRCHHIKVNGVQCGSPALRKLNLCHFHQRWQMQRIELTANQARRDSNCDSYALDLPVLEDANSIQVALMQTMRMLLTGQVDHRTAALLFYGLQTASINLRRTKFEPRPERVVIDPAGAADTSLGDDAWYLGEFEEEDQTEPQIEANEPALLKSEARVQHEAKTIGETNAEISAFSKKSFDLQAVGRRETEGNGEFGQRLMLGTHESMP